jgi:hypothetical protein
VTVFGQVGPPQASFPFTPADPTSGEIISFDATGSTDDGRIDSYFWDFEDDGAYDATGSAGYRSCRRAGSLRRRGRRRSRFPSTSSARRCCPRPTPARSA